MRTKAARRSREMRREILTSIEEYVLIFELFFKYDRAYGLCSFKDLPGNVRHFFKKHFP